MSDPGLPVRLTGDDDSADAALGAVRRQLIAQFPDPRTPFEPIPPHRALLVLPKPQESQYPRYRMGMDFGADGTLHVVVGMFDTGDRFTRFAPNAIIRDPSGQIIPPGTAITLSHDSTPPVPVEGVLEPALKRPDGAPLPWGDVFVFPSGPAEGGSDSYFTHMRGRPGVPFDVAVGFEPQETVMDLDGIQRIVRARLCEISLVPLQQTVDTLNADRPPRILGQQSSAGAATVAMQAYEATMRRAVAAMQKAMEAIAERAIAFFWDMGRMVGDGLVSGIRRRSIRHLHAARRYQRRMERQAQHPTIHAQHPPWHRAKRRKY